jgi:hypothetical protein
LLFLHHRAHRQDKELSEREKDELRSAREHDRFAREEALQVTISAVEYQNHAGANQENDRRRGKACNRSTTPKHPQRSHVIMAGAVAPRTSIQALTEAL